MDIVLDSGYFLLVRSFPVQNNTICSYAGKGQSWRDGNFQTQKTDKLL
jgi:hypothetical protein